VIHDAGVSSDDDANDPEWMVVREWGMELRFAEDGEQRLRQIALDDPRFRWAGKALLDEPLHLALAALGEAARDAGWRPENALLTEFDDLTELPPAPTPMRAYWARARFGCRFRELDS
jgi:hypothetical protein